MVPDPGQSCGLTTWPLIHAADHYMAFILTFQERLVVKLVRWASATEYSRIPTIEIVVMVGQMTLAARSRRRAPTYYLLWLRSFKSGARGISAWDMYLTIKSCNSLEMYPRRQSAGKHA